MQLLPRCEARGRALAYSSILARRNNRGGSTRNHSFMNRLCVLGSISYHALEHLICRYLPPVNRGSLLHHSHYWTSQRSPESARSGRLCRCAACAIDADVLHHAFLHFQSPSPRSLIPVESSRKFSPPKLGRYATCTSRLRCLRHSVMKSGTGHGSPDNASNDCTKPAVCRKAKPNRFLKVRQNWRQHPRI